MLINPLREKLSNGEHIVNTWLAIPNSWTAELIATVGYDTVTIDVQHGLMDYQVMLSMLQAISTTEATPIVRATWNEPGILMKILDAGAWGIIAPMISTKEDAEQFVGACRYPPLGYRSYGPMRASVTAGQDYYKHSNDQVLTIAMIETKEAVENIDDILSVEGLDGIYIGTIDLSYSLGIESLGELHHPDLKRSIDKIMGSVKKHEKFAGMHTRTIEEIDVLKVWGIQIITPMNDSRLLQSTSQTVLDQTRAKLE